MATETETAPPIQRSSRWPVLYDFPDFKRDPLTFWLETGRLAPVVRVRLGPTRPFWVVTDADWFQHIFQKNARNYPRDRQIRNRNGIDRSETVFNAPTYEEWLWRRRLLQPAFHRQQLSTFGEQMVVEAQQIVAETTVGETHDLAELMKTLTMRIICRTMFSASLDETERLLEAFEQTNKFSYQRLSAMFNLPLWIPTPEVERTRAAVQVKRDTVGRIVDERFASGESKGDLLDLLIGAHLDEDGRQFTSNDLISEMNSVVFAGHETTAMTLTWLFYMLTQRPDLEAKLMMEIDAVLRDRSPTLGDLEQMPFTHQLIQETLRFFPSVYVTLREAEDEDTFGGYDIPAGTQFVMNIRGLHRDKRYWEDPDRFMPSRFAAERDGKRHKFAFQPFISGPKKCIGDAFAMMEMRLVVPAIMQQIRFQYASPNPVQEAAGFVMITKEPIDVIVKPR